VWTLFTGAAVGDLYISESSLVTLLVIVNVAENKISESKKPVSNAIVAVAAKEQT